MNDTGQSEGNEGNEGLSERYERETELNKV